jgi:hypothetical protein
MTKAGRNEIARAKKAAALASRAAKKAAAAAARADKKHLALVAREHAKAERAKLAALKRERGLRVPQAYTFTIFDADPSSSGNTNWPSHTGVPIAALAPGIAMDRALQLAARAGYSSGEYRDGDRLWVLVYTPDGRSLKGSITL